MVAPTEKKITKKSAPTDFGGPPRPRLILECRYFLMGKTISYLILSLIKQFHNTKVTGDPVLQAEHTQPQRSGKGKDVKTCNYLTQLPHVLQLEPCFTCVLNLSKQKWEGYRCWKHC